MLNVMWRVGAFYNRKELGFSGTDQFLAQCFAGFLALTAAAIWPSLLAVGFWYVLLAAGFAFWPIRTKIQQFSAAGRLRPFTIREQKLSQLAAACTFLWLASMFPNLIRVNFYAIVAATASFAARPLYLLYLKNEKLPIRAAGLALLAVYFATSLLLHSMLKV